MKKQSHKAALNNYLTTRPQNEIMYANETAKAYVSKLGPEGVYRHKNGDITIKAAMMLPFGLLGDGGQDSIGMDITRIQEKHIGMNIPWFKAMELKLPGDKLKDKQIKWYKIMKAFGVKTEVLLYKNGVYTPIDVDRQGTRVIS